MNGRGFSLVEVVTVLAIIGTLTAIATLNFNAMQRKSGIETQTKMLFSDLMDARSQAMFTRAPCSVTVASSTFSHFPGTDISVTPAARRDLKYPVTWTAGGSMLRIDFNSRGMSGPETALCIQESDNQGTHDSIVISPTTIRMGKRNAGGQCRSDDIVFK